MVDLACPGCRSRQIVIEHQAADLVAKDARIASLEEDVVRYRAIALAALGMLSALNDRRRLEQENRELRASLMQIDTLVESAA